MCHRVTRTLLLEPLRFMWPQKIELNYPNANARRIGAMCANWCLFFADHTFDFFTMSSITGMDRPNLQQFVGGVQLVDSNVAIETIDPCKPWGMLAAVLGNAPKEISINMGPYETITPGQGKRRKLGDNTYEGAQVCVWGAWG